MAISRGWRQPVALHGPSPIRREDIAPINEVFSDAFSDRYRKDGMVGVRVPHLNPQIWRYAIEDAAGGAMLWRDDRGHIAAFNIAHLSGTEGWMGPLAVRPDAQGGGAGKEVVRAGIAWLDARGATTIGLETMPRTMDNIGFYSNLGFQPGRMTFTLTLDARPAERAAALLARLPGADHVAAVEECRALAAALSPGRDFTREILLTEELSLGDTLLLRDADGSLIGFALCHSAPLVEGRSREELRVLKLALAAPEHLDAMARALADHARRAGTRRAALRVQGAYDWAYRRLIELGARVRWTDLRMALADRPELGARGGLLLSNWEI